MARTDTDRDHRPATVGNGDDAGANGGLAVRDEPASAGRSVPAGDSGGPQLTRVPVGEAGQRLAALVKAALVAEQRVALFIEGLAGGLGIEASRVRGVDDETNELLVE